MTTSKAILDSLLNSSFIYLLFYFFIVIVKYKIQQLNAFTAGESLHKIKNNWKGRKGKLFEL